MRSAADVAGLLQRMRSPEGEQLVFEQNFFIETFVPTSIIRSLSEEEMEAYRRPFREPRSRTPTLAWPRELPIEGEPQDVAEIVRRYGGWLAESPLPKLLVKAEPGAFLVGRAYEFCRSWPDQDEASVSGIHFVQEDSPDEIGASLREFSSVVEW